MRRPDYVWVRNLLSETVMKISLQEKSMMGELRRRSFHTSDAFFDMDSRLSAWLMTLMLQIVPQMKILLACRPVDFRKWIDSLCVFTQKMASGRSNTWFIRNFGDDF
jgi:hypothetical protein